jgi:hypothetical protein
MGDTAIILREDNVTEPLSPTYFQNEWMLHKVMSFLDWNPFFFHSVTSSFPHQLLLLHLLLCFKIHPLPHPPTVHTQNAFYPTKRKNLQFPSFRYVERDSRFRLNSILRSRIPPFVSCTVQIRALFIISRNRIKPMYKNKRRFTYSHMRHMALCLGKVNGVNAASEDVSCTFNLICVPQI